MGFHAIDLDTSQVFDLYIPSHVSKDAWNLLRYMTFMVSLSVMIQCRAMNFCLLILEVSPNSLLLSFRNLNTFMYFYVRKGRVCVPMCKCVCVSKRLCRCTCVLKDAGMDDGIWPILWAKVFSHQDFLFIYHILIEKGLYKETNETAVTVLFHWLLFKTPTVLYMFRIKFRF